MQAASLFQPTFGFTLYKSLRHDLAHIRYEYSQTFLCGAIHKRSFRPLTVYDRERVCKNCLNKY